MDVLQYIEINPTVMLGKPVIKGTRITVELILEKLSKGETMQDILVAHPHITQEAIYAALAFAALNLKNTHYYPIAS
ncbi:Uncharacterized conserved protein, DUF433 family [Chitinophaga terrae (ex Kim and Jung 2007)]|uniref:Uncharacterized conserved protein, DUF433 family n=1 Tax=Chitinophaga terrae (ex Kim and Jung 2007) TaxID=408074 RepID=A0A1H4A2H1_9BACT|nr:DUF433 domain-containing protein [Chitinophaga terrae (ex Kim and Jung 2007)]GEP90020.1 hypothetical protein CTE07_16650 [Chitinophaga terrae (ex Kim and Jung 2007)]SEA30333.1 Uncharacterized conserved protein, DUF433 family [Chitinophaga terrae (ex Kim and Jung 2007)]